MTNQKLFLSLRRKTIIWTVFLVLFSAIFLWLHFVYEKVLINEPLWFRIILAVPGLIAIICAVGAHLYFRKTMKLILSKNHQ